MGRAEGGISTEPSEPESGNSVTSAYISPLVDFLLLFVLTVSGALSVALVL
jgi:hypothetical protein